MASVQGNPGFPDGSTQMRRLLGPYGGAAHQDVLVVAHLDVSSVEENDIVARA